MRRNRVVWSSSARDPDSNLVWGPAAPLRAGRLRHFIRTCVLFLLVGLMRRPCWRSVALGAALIIPGLILRSAPAGIILLPGLLILFAAPFLPGGPDAGDLRHSKLWRELAAYSTPSQRRDLEAILDQYPDGMTRELRDILSCQVSTLPAADPRIPGAGH